jgi:hypothetical protein
MLQKSSLKFQIVIFLLLGIFLIVSPSQAAQKKILTFEDVMRFKEIRNPAISGDGLWIIYATLPDRGDGEAVVHGLKNGANYVVERGSRPQLTKDAKWVAMIVTPKAVEMTKTPKDRPQQGMAILETATGEVTPVEKVQSFALSEDSRWIAYLHHKEEEKSPKKEDGASEGKNLTADKKNNAKKTIGSLLVLHELGTGRQKEIPHVLAYSFDNASQYIAFTVSSPDGSEDGLFYLDLTRESPEQNPIVLQENMKFSGFAWTKKGNRLAFLANTDDDEDGHFSLWIWDGNSKEKTSAVAANAVPASWMIPEKNQVSWSKDGKRLFFGLKPLEIHQATQKPESKEGEKDISEEDLFDTQNPRQKGAGCVALERSLDQNQ